MLASKKADSNNENNVDVSTNAKQRKYLRWQFQSSNVPLVFQSRGVPIKLYRRVFLYDQYIGKGIIKDISLAGAGFISSKPLPEIVIIKLPNGATIKCAKQHQFQVNEYLTFYGVSWGKSVYQRILPFLKNYSRKAYRPKDKKLAAQFSEK